MRANALVNLGAVAGEAGKDEEALANYDAGRALAEKHGLRATLFHGYWGRGEVEAGLKQYGKAVESYGKAIEQIEFLREKAREPGLQMSFFGQYTTPYLKLCTALLVQERGAEAFAVGEQARARALVDLLEGSGTLVTGDLAQEERDRERRLVEQLHAAVQREHTAYSDDEVQASRREVASAMQELQRFQAALYREHPTLRDQRGQFKPATLEDLQKELFRHEPKLAVLSYLVGDSYSLLFVSTPGPRTHIHLIKVGREELARRVRAFRHRCSSDGSDYAGEAAALYKLLVAPAGKQLEGRAHLAILPDGPLHNLPFQALIGADRKHLIENYSLSYAPSATALLKMRQLAQARRDKPPLAALVLGRPSVPDKTDLEHTETEARAVAEHFGVAPLLGKEATRARALADMSKADVIHIAAHGEANEAAPLFSYVALTGTDRDPGRLYAHELMGLKLRARLVVLSACQTARGQLKEGEGLLGLGWALFVARAPTSILSQWNVNDRSTSELNREFYAGLRKHSPAESLRMAQLKLLREEKTRHPYHWAAFVLMGEWK
jgi:CHAT domain-containing protein